MTDLAASLIIWLRTQVTGATVAASVPRELPDKLLLVRRLGGTFDHPVIDQPTIGIEAWGRTQAQAHDLCQDARARIWSLRGGILNNVAIYRVEEFAGPAWLPDPDHDGRPRYVATFSIGHREHLAV